MAKKRLTVKKIIKELKESGFQEVTEEMKKKEPLRTIYKNLNPKNPCK